MYRSRLKGKLNPRALDYLSSIDDDNAILYYDIIGSEAHSMMLFEQGLLTKEELTRILTALRQASRARLDMSDYEDIHEAVEAYVIKKAGPVAGGKMHTARSRNDQVALDIRLKTRDDINIISFNLLALIRILLEKAHANRRSIMPMYTHMQHAQIGTFAHYLTSYADWFFRDLDRLNDCYIRTNLSPLGAVAIGGTSINIDRERVARLLAFDGIVENSIDATSSRDMVIEFCFCLSTVMLTISRISEDLVIWSSSEFDFVELDDEFASSSSVMPQKKNPCPLELMRARAAYVLGLLVTLSSTVKSLPSGYSRDLQDTKRVLFDAVRITNRTIVLMISLIETAKVKKQNMLQSAKHSHALALDIAEELVRNGLAFREAHKLVGNIVKLVSEKGRTFNDLKESDIIAALGRENGLQIAKIVKKFTPELSISMRRSKGSPNPKELERMIRTRRKMHKKVYRLVQKRSEAVDKAFRNIDGTKSVLMLRDRQAQ